MKLSVWYKWCVQPTNFRTEQETCGVGLWNEGEAAKIQSDSCARFRISIKILFPNVDENILVNP